MRDSVHAPALLLGPTAGGTVVTIHGIGFTASATYGSWCRWEHIAVVPARVLHAQVVTCVAPSSPEPRRVQVTLQLNNVLTRTSASFRFVAVPTVNFYPLLGPVEGGTQLLLDGTLMIAADWWCRFDQIVVPARRATSTRLQVLKNEVLTNSHSCLVDICDVRCGAPCRLLSASLHHTTWGSYKWP